MNIQIWSEGFIITGNSSGATKMWEGEAINFNDAVRQYNEESVQRYGKISAEKGTVLDGKTMQPIDDWRIWGCKLFDNEKDARKSFG